MAVQYVITTADVCDVSVIRVLYFSGLRPQLLSIFAQYEPFLRGLRVLSKQFGFIQEVHHKNHIGSLDDISGEWLRPMTLQCDTKFCGNPTRPWVRPAGSGTRASGIDR